MLVQLNSRGYCRNTSGGFTFIELLVTIAMIGILGSLAIPSFRAFIINQQVSSASSDFFGSLLQARSEALKLGRIVAIFPTDGSNWTSGWYLSVVDNNCVATGDPFGRTNPVGSFISVKSSGTTKSFSSSSPSFAYNPVGYPYISCGSPFYSGQMNGTLTFQTLETSREKRIIVSMAGRARICDPKRETCTAD